MGVGGDDSAGKPVRALLAVDSTGYVMLFHRVSPRQISPPSEKAGGQERTSLACRRTTRGAEAAPHAAPSASGKLTKGTCRPHPAICPDSAALGCSDPQHDCRRPVLCTGAKSAQALLEVCFDVKELEDVLAHGGPGLCFDGHRARQRTELPASSRRGLTRCLRRRRTTWRWQQNGGRRMNLAGGPSGPRSRPSSSRCGPRAPR